MTAFVYSTIKLNYWSHLIYDQKYRINYYNSEEVDKINKSQMFSTAKKSKIIKKVEEVFPDVELIDIELDKNN